MIFEELNFLARHNFQSIKEVEFYKADLEKQLPELKGKREDLWRKYHKSTNEDDKNIIKRKSMNLLKRLILFKLIKMLVIGSLINMLK